MGYLIYTVALASAGYFALNSALTSLAINVAGL